MRNANSIKNGAPIYTIFNFAKKFKLCNSHMQHIHYHTNGILSADIII